MRRLITTALIGAFMSVATAAVQAAQPWGYRGLGPRVDARMSGAEAATIARYWIQAYLRRPASPEEVRYWADQLQRYPAINALTAILSSQEYYDYAGGSPPEYIRQLIEHVGHHHATRFEIADRLRSTRGLKPRDIAQRFLTEYPANWWPGPSATPPPELEQFYEGHRWHW